MYKDRSPLHKNAWSSSHTSDTPRRTPSCTVLSFGDRLRRPPSSLSARSAESCRGAELSTGARKVVVDYSKQLQPSCYGRSEREAVECFGDRAHARLAKPLAISPTKPAAQDSKRLLTPDPRFLSTSRSQLSSPSLLSTLVRCSRSRLSAPCSRLSTAFSTRNLN